MLKAEKYKEKIKELGYTFGLHNGELKNCRDIRCDKCEFGTIEGYRCNDFKTKWLLEEYNEPILNEKENYMNNDEFKTLENNFKSLVKNVELLNICMNSLKDKNYDLLDIQLHGLDIRIKILVSQMYEFQEYLAKKYKINRKETDSYE